MWYSRTIEVSWDTLGVYRGFMGYSTSLMVPWYTLGA